MAWNIIAVDAPASGVKIDPDSIPEELAEAVEEMVANLTELKRGVVSFIDETARDVARAQIRAYCEARPAGRLKASIWAGYTDGVSKFAAKITEDMEFAALSLAFTPYVKRTNNGPAPHHSA